MTLQEIVASGRPFVDIPVAGEAMFGCSKTTAYELARAGVLPTVKLLGRRKVVPVAALVAMAQGGDPGQKSAPPADGPMGRLDHAQDDGAKVDGRQ